MNDEDVHKLIKKLDIKKIRTIEEHEFDEPSNILILELINPLKISVHTINGLMGFVIDELRFDTTYKTLFLMFEETELFIAPLSDVKKIIKRGNYTG